MPWNDRVKRRLKLRDLDFLAALIDTGSMGKAASRLNISQPAVSKAIAELEQALGVRLVDRGRRGITPTPFGLALKKRTRSLMTCAKAFRTSTSFPTRQWGKYALVRLSRSRLPSYRLASTGCLENTNAFTFMSLPVTRQAFSRN